jgi:hypothetical protein
MKARTAVLALSGVLFAASTSQAQVFDFETTPLGTVTPISVTSGGLTAQFSSPDGGVFVIVPTFFSSLTGQVLLDNDLAQHTLLVAFSHPLTAISLNFALNAPGNPAATLSLAAMNGATLVGSTSASGSVPPGFLFPEGVLTFVGGPFNNVAITSSAQDFAVDNIAVRQATAVPEPVTLALLLPGVLLLGAAAARRG